MGIRWVGSTAALLTVVMLGQASFGEEGKSSLRGVKAFSVVVLVNKNLADFGITDARMQPAVEAAMRKARVPLVNKADNPLKPFLVVEVNAMPTDQGFFVYAVSLNFIQAVTLVDDPKDVKFAITWKTGSFGFVGTKKTDALRGFILEEVDKFINDYLAENPDK